MIGKRTLQKLSGEELESLLTGKDGKGGASGASRNRVLFEIQRRVMKKGKR